MSSSIVNASVICHINKKERLHDMMKIDAEKYRNDHPNQGLDDIHHAIIWRQNNDTRKNRRTWKGRCIPH